MIDTAGNSGGGVEGIPEFRRTSYDWTVTPPSTAIVEMIADIEGVDPVALFSERGGTLYDYVDPEALDALFCDGRETIKSMCIELDQYLVRISDHELVVEVDYDVRG